MPALTVSAECMVLFANGFSLGPICCNDGVMNSGIICSEFYCCEVKVSLGADVSPFICYIFLLFLL